jgi:hypothetical protein
VLAKGLQNHAVAHVHVQMGKLHIGLGLMTYVLGAIAAGTSVNSYQANWEQTVRSGNGEAQAGAIMSMAGSGGLLASNLYGLGHTLDATATVFWPSKEPPEPPHGPPPVRGSQAFFPCEPGWRAVYGVGAGR